MRRFAASALVLVAVFLAATAIRSALTDAAAQGRPPGAAGTPPPGGMPQFAPVPGDSFAAERDSLMNVVLHSIAGKENVAAESVFKDIKVLKGVPAGRLPRIMNLGYGRSLGVRCAHCHVQDQWEKDDKPQKQIARDMADLSRTLNTELLPKIKNLKSEHPVVNCTTCHRGQVKPATNL